jgi:hypothetical protein
MNKDKAMASSIKLRGPTKPILNFQVCKSAQPCLLSNRKSPCQGRRTVESDAVTIWVDLLCIGVLGFDVQESVHRDTTMEITNKMHYID